MQIEVKNLSYTYGKKSAFQVKALNNISLTIKEGEYLGIIGHTGSGKSTFVQHLNGLIKIQKESGSITLGDYNLADKKCNFLEVRSKIGMLFQYPEHQLFAETVEKDVAFGLNNLYKLTEEETKNRVKEALETVGLNYEEIKNRSPFELSGGQKRRVAIAGVIVTKPEILVLDEPVAGLDPSGKKELLELLDRLHNDYVKTIIFVTHDMNIVAEKCTRVVVFDGGNVKYNETPKQLFSRVNELENIGLKLPLTAILTNEIKNKLNIELNTNYSVDSFVNELIEKLK